jgi:hypothetical protein
MRQSHIIDIDGLFVGVAIHLDSGFRFVATDTRLKALDAIESPDMATLRRLARQALIRSQTNYQPARSVAALNAHDHRSGNRQQMPDATPVPQPRSTRDDPSPHLSRRRRHGSVACHHGFRGR